MTSASGSHSAKALGTWLPSERVPRRWRELEICHLHLDSRLVKPGDGFFALANNPQQRQAHITQALAAGAVAIFIDAGAETPELPKHIALVQLADMATELPVLAASFYDFPCRELTVIGVTGTNGKSTCVYLLAQLLAGISGKPVGIVGTLGYGLWHQPPAPTGMTTPDVVSNQRILRDLVRQGACAVAMEVSSHGLDQQRVAGVSFAAALFTNLSRDHLDYHGTMAAYGAAKARLFARTELQLAVINADDEAADMMRAALPHTTPLLTYGLTAANVDLRVENLAFSTEGASFTLCSPWGNRLLTSPLVGAFNVHNLVGVLAVLLTFHPEAWSLLPALVSNLRPVAGRMQQITQVQRPSVVVDYAHTPDALEQALRNIRRHCSGKLWLVFGCGGDRDSGKRPLMAAIAERLADVVVITDDNPRRESSAAILADIRAGFTTLAATEIADRATAIHWAINRAANDDWVLIAGKGHETYQLIGDTILPFDDYACALDALRARGNFPCV